MNILIYSPYSLDNNSTPVLLDEALEYLQTEGNKVLFVTCSGELKPCDSNYEQSSIRCKECMFSTYLLTKKIKHPNIIFKRTKDYINNSSKNRANSLNFTYNSINEVKSLEFNGINIGNGVVSSYVSMTRNLSPAFNKETRHFFDKSLQASALLTIATIQMIDEFKPDLVCLFNGRFGGLRPVLEVCLKQKIEISILECTFATNREIQQKVKFTNALPHDIDKNTPTIENYWKEWENCNERELVASEFYNNRRNAIVASDNVYIGNQISDLLPDDWDKSKRNFVIFNSSEDEFFCVGESFDKYKLFNDQIEGIRYLAQNALTDSSIHFYLRVHPNLSNIKFNYHTKLADIFNDLKNLTIIPSISPISTYKLIDNCEKIFVFGSTAGAEATYWGKPVILLGGAFYIHLDAAYYPANRSELNKLIFKQLLPKPKLGALKYALFIFGKRGTPYKYVNFNYKIIKFSGKILLIPKCYQYKNSLFFYLFVLSFFRIANIFSHAIFKLITMKKLMIEDSKFEKCNPVK